MPCCSLCRAPWPAGTDPELVDACAALAVNPFLDSDADAPIPSRPLDPAPTPAMPRASATPAPGGLWHTRGPPAAPVLVPANSWLYVPLLHAAAGDLHADALEAWRRDSRAAPWWDSTSQALAAAAPVTADTLRSALLDHSPDGASSAARLAHSAANTPADARFHLGWACRALADISGYLPAAAQEVLLQTYGGLRLAAAVNERSNAFRPEDAADTPHGALRRRRRAHPRSSVSPAVAAPATGMAVTTESAIPIPASSSESEPPPPATDVLALPPRTSVPPVAVLDSSRGSRSDAPATRPLAPAPSAPSIRRVPAASWDWLDRLDLASELATPVRTIRSPPRFYAAAARRALLFPLQLIAADAATPLQRRRGWALFLLASRLLFYHPAGATVGRRALLQRADDFLAGSWPSMLASAHAQQPSPGPRARAARTAEEEATLRRARACRQVAQGDLSRARAALTASPLAPGTAATLESLVDPARRPPALLRPIPDHISNYCPDAALHLSEQEVVDALRTAKRSAAPGLSGATAEHFKLLLDDGEALTLFTGALTQLANAHVPPEVLTAISQSRLTALAKPGGGARGIATGDSLRRLTSRILARKFAATFDVATRPYQFALQTRAGIDALAGLLRAAVDLDPRTAVVSLDGRSAYDCVSRSAIFTALHTTAPALVPFVRAIYGTPSIFHWWDDQGAHHVITQGEGVEQGDPLAPALYALGQHHALEVAAAQLLPDEVLAAYLDDVYIICQPDRARPAFDIVSRAIEGHAGVAANSGKTRVFTRAGGPAPPGVETLGPDVWRGGDSPECGLVALGAPIGSADFVAAHAHGRLEQETGLLAEIQQLPDLQAAWLLLLYTAAPRAGHLLRTLPPSQSGEYARQHDSAVWSCLSFLLGEPDPLPATVRDVGFLPIRLGGLGLFAAERIAPAAYWAAWADALPVLALRQPILAARCAAELTLGPESAAACLREAAASASELDRYGWQSRPGWAVLAANASEVPNLREREPGIPAHGWQHLASLVVHTSFRAREVLPRLPPAGQALLRSQAGPHAGAWLTAIPSEEGATLTPNLMHIALRRRLRLPLPPAAQRCGQGARRHGCGGALDPLGDHALACPRSGLLARRAHVLEHAWIRVAREAVGSEGRVVPQPWLAHTNLATAVDDRRRLDLLIHGATPRGEALACDVTLVSPLTRSGQPTRQAATHDGAALLAARARKHRRYPELLGGGPQRLLVLGAEVGGRWHSECLQLVRLLVAVRSPRAPPPLRQAAAQGWQRRWWGFLSIALQKAVCATALGVEWISPPLPHASAPGMARLLDAVPMDGASRLPLSFHASP